MLDAYALGDAATIARLTAENAILRDRLDEAEQYTARTLLRATRLAQVISVLAGESDLDTIVERAAVEVAELFSADVAVLMLGQDDQLTIAGQCGVRPKDLPTGRFALPGSDLLSSREAVRVGPAEDAALPEWLSGYGARHVACARLLVGEQSVGFMLLIRRGPEPFEGSDQTELRAMAYRIALAIENGLLQRRMSRQIERLHRLQQLTTELAGTLELEAVGDRVAEMLVAEVPVIASAVYIERGGQLLSLSSAGATGVAGSWEYFALDAAGKPVGKLAVMGPPPAGSADRELLLQIVGLAALALDKALLYEQSQDQARHDSLTGLLGHRVFHEVLAERMGHGEQFSVVLVDIDDFKQVNDLHGHQTGDDALRLVASALRQVVRPGDSVFRVGGEEFCAVLPGLGHDDAFHVAERLRTSVAGLASPVPVTVSLGIAGFPVHGEERDELLARADAALYASKRGGKNRATVAGADSAARSSRGDGEARLALLHQKDPPTAAHSVQVATLAVEVARALGMEEDRLDDLRVAAQLHDIGKIGIPDAILGKPGRLDEDEFRIIETHPIVGSELLKAWGLTGPARFVLQHHERVDGTGYPARLRGDEIALESRVIHAADAYVAMTLDRPYRRAMAPSMAFDELRRHAGTQFDRDVVDALLGIERTRLRRPA